eukprot:579373_1
MQTNGAVYWQWHVLCARNDSPEPKSMAQTHHNRWHKHTTHHDRLRPSLTNLLSQNTTDTNERDTKDDTIHKRDDDEEDNINKHLEWYGSKHIPHLLDNKLSTNKHETVSTKLIYHPQLQDFILLVITQKRNKDEWTFDLFERDAKPFLWICFCQCRPLYGRGAADDGYSVFCAVNSIGVLQDQNVSHPRCCMDCLGTCDFETHQNEEWWKKHGSSGQGKGRKN